MEAVIPRTGIRIRLGLSMICMLTVTTSIGSHHPMDFRVFWTRDEKVPNTYQKRPKTNQKRPGKSLAGYRLVEDFHTVRAFYPTRLCLVGANRRRSAGVEKRLNIAAGDAPAWSACPGLFRKVRCLQFAVANPGVNLVDADSEFVRELRRRDECSNVHKKPRAALTWA